MPTARVRANSSLAARQLVDGVDPDIWIVGVHRASPAVQLRQNNGQNPYNQFL